DRDPGLRPAHGLGSRAARDPRCGPARGRGRRGRSRRRDRERAGPRGRSTARTRARLIPQPKFFRADAGPEGKTRSPGSAGERRLDGGGLLRDLAAEHLRAGLRHEHVVLDANAADVVVLGEHAAIEVLLEPAHFVRALENANYSIEPRLDRHGHARQKVAIEAQIALPRSEEHTSELQSRENLVCRLLLEKKKSVTSVS